MHIFEHFAQEICTNCDKRLIRIGSALFVLHTTVTCVNANSDPANKSEAPLLIEVTPRFPQTEVYIKEEVHENYIIDDKEMNFDRQDPIGSNSKEKYSENSIVECTHDGCKKRIKSYMLHDHMIKEHSVILRCHECGEICETKSKFARHLQSHIEPDQLTCESCNLSLGKISKFGSRKELQMHMIRRHDPKRKAKDREYQNQIIKCPVEGCEEMVKKYNSATHQKEKHGMGTKCDICHRIFLTDLSFKQHKKQHDNNLSFPCDICGTSFTTLRSLRMHMNTHSSAYQLNRAKTLTVKCDIDGCDMTIRKDKILVHRKEQHGIGHRCKQCNELFEIESKLNEHILTHAMDVEPNDNNRSSSSANGISHSIFFHSNSNENDPIASTATLEQVKCTFDGCSMRIEKHLLKNHMIKEHNVGLKCNECGEIFESRTLLLAHLNSHIDPHQLTCTICNMELGFITKFSTRTRLQMHMSKKHDPIRKQKELERKNSLIKCALCDDMIKRVNSSYHLREKHGVGIKCSFGSCQKLCLNEASLKQHVKQHDTNSNFPCAICSISFGTERGLKFHMNTHSLVYQLNRNRNTTIKCTIDDCNTMVRRGEYHIEHLNVRHGIENKCKDCGKLFVLESKLNGHIIMEHKMSIFISAVDNNQVAICDVCQARLINKDSFLEHMKEHFPTRMEPKKYECHCGKKLTSKQNLIEHDMKVHKNNLPKNFVCSVCGKCFYKSSQLKRHERIHAGIKPFECNSCGKTFSKKSSRDLHLHVHTKERPFKCDFENCDRVYSYPIDLRKHKANVHGIWSQKIPCEQCEEVFPEKSKLRKHIQTMHAGDGQKL